MTRFCSACGQQARPDDRHCIGCGADINPTAQPKGGAAFRAPTDRRRRTGSFVVRHARGLMALLVVAAIGVAVGVNALVSDGNTAPRRTDTAPADAVAAESAAQAAQTPTQTPHRAARSVTVRGAGGKRFSCPFSALDRVDAAQARVKRREKVLSGRRAEVRQIERQYPKGTTPPTAVIAHYEAALARTNAQVTWTNKAITQYNRALVDACGPQ